SVRVDDAIQEITARRAGSEGEKADAEIPRQVDAGLALEQSIDEQREVDGDRGNLADPKPDRNAVHLEEGREQNAEAHRQDSRKNEGSVEQTGKSAVPEQ